MSQPPYFGLRTHLAAANHFANPVWELNGRVRLTLPAVTRRFGIRSVRMVDGAGPCKVVLVGGDGKRDSIEFDVSYWVRGPKFPRLGDPNGTEAVLSVGSPNGKPLGFVEISAKCDRSGQFELDDFFVYPPLVPTWPAPERVTVVSIPELPAPTRINDLGSRKLLEWDPPIALDHQRKPLDQIARSILNSEVIRKALEIRSEVDELSLVSSTPPFASFTQSYRWGDRLVLVSGSEIEIMISDGYRLSRVQSSFHPGLNIAHKRPISERQALAAARVFGLKRPEAPTLRVENGRLVYLISDGCPKVHVDAFSGHAERFDVCARCF